MPRRNINAGPKLNGGDPAVYNRLADTLRDEWAVKTGKKTWQQIREDRGGASGAAAAKRRVERKAKQAAERTVTMDDARALLAAYL